MHHVSIVTATKRQPELSLPSDQVGKGIVLSVVIGTTNIRHLNLRKGISSGESKCESNEKKNPIEPHGLCSRVRARLRNHRIALANQFALTEALPTAKNFLPHLFNFRLRIFGDN